MNFESVLRNDEKVMLGLRLLYEQYGYSQYKMSKFEEYELYSKNRDFLPCDRIITFTGTNGKLMALKPDVTFSIIKNTQDASALVQKVYYNENVYRISKRTQDFKEIMQAGLECIGDIDLYNVCEVLMLAAKSLEIISGDYILDISHMGFVEGLLDELSATPFEKERVLKCVGEKNAHEIKSILGEKCGRITALMECCGKADYVLNNLEKISVNDKTEGALNELKSIMEAFRKSGFYEKIRLDFSVINNMNYYNGLVFQGFVNKIPEGVLSGGRYDKLLRKMGKKSGAIGFAVYLDLLQRLGAGEKAFDVDTVVVYGGGTSVEKINETVKTLTGEGKSVLVQKTVPHNIKYKNLVSLENGGYENG